MVLEFYYDLKSQPCRAIFLFLKGTGIQFEAHPLELFKGEQRSPEILKKNPYHKLPFIDDNGFILAESVAIMRYLATKYKTDEHWYPRTNAEQQARVDEFLHWHHHCVRRQCIDVFIPTLRSQIKLAEAMPIQPMDVDKVKNAKEEVARAVTHIADYFLRDNPYIGGKEISAADLTGVSELYQLNGVCEEGLYTCNEKVNAWVERVKQRLQPHFDEAVERILEVRKRFCEASGKK